MVGRNSKRVFRLGDLVRVRVAGVDLENSNVDFELVPSANGGAPKPKNGEEKPKAAEEKPKPADGKQPSKRRRRAKNPGKVAKDPEK